MRANRDLLRSALFIPVKNRAALVPGLQAIKPTVSFGMIIMC